MHEFAIHNADALHQLVVDLDTAHVVGVGVAHPCVVNLSLE